MLKQCSKIIIVLIGINLVLISGYFAIKSLDSVVTNVYYRNDKVWQICQKLAGDKNIRICFEEALNPADVLFTLNYDEIKVRDLLNEIVNLAPQYTWTVWKEKIIGKVRGQMEIEIINIYPRDPEQTYLDTLLPEVNLNSDHNFDAFNETIKTLLMPYNIEFRYYGVLVKVRWPESYRCQIRTGPITVRELLNKIIAQDECRSQCWFVLSGDGKQYLDILPYTFDGEFHQKQLFQRYQEEAKEKENVRIVGDEKAFAVYRLTSGILCINDHGYISRKREDIPDNIPTWSLNTEQFIEDFEDEHNIP